MENKEILTRLGLNKNESLIYLALLEHGPSLISGISRNTTLHRPLVYKAIKSLENKGLTTTSPKGKQKLYSAESPEKLEILIEQLKDDFEKFVPEMKQLYENKKDKPILKFFGGKGGITAVIEDLLETLNKGEIYYRYSSRKAETEAVKYFPVNYFERRDAKGIQRFVISNSDLVSKRKLDMNRFVKALPANYGLFNQNIAQFIYSSKIAFIDYNNENGIIIENAAIAEFQKKIFKTLFDRL